MTDKKLTDEEVVKALECCISTTTEDACVGCPFNKQKLCDKDQWALEKYALDLINRQKAEIDNLNKQMEWLTGYNGNLINVNTALSEEILLAKTEAYKEFAERLENEINIRTTYSREQDKNVIRIMHNLLKEMVGEEE